LRITELKANGTVTAGFEPVQAAFEALWDEVEVGASLCIFRDGEKAVDLWGGHTDRDMWIPWQADTLVNVYSTTKGIVSLALACLVEEGLLDYDRPVVDYWSQFGAERKFDITVAQLLSHQAGLYRFVPAVSVEDLYDFQKMCFNLASQAPAWEPGTAFGYHSITWGYLAGEIIRNITDRTPGQYIARQITEPLHADFYLGVPQALNESCATLIGPNHARATMPARSRISSTERLKNEDPVITPYRDASSAAWRNAEIPASNGHASSRGLARCYAAALSGELFSPEALRLATTEVTHGEVDKVLGYPARRAMGFILSCEDVWFGPSPNAFGHSGTGGSTAFADPDAGIAFAYVTNQLHTSGAHRSRKIIDALYNCL
jgi:CubicO group peptidase (beta-lactamase class C family)